MEMDVDMQKAHISQYTPHNDVLPSLAGICLSF